MINRYTEHIQETKTTPPRSTRMGLRSRLDNPLRPHVRTFNSELPFFTTKLNTNTLAHQGLRSLPRLRKKPLLVAAPAHHPPLDHQHHPPRLDPLHDPARAKQHLDAALLPLSRPDPGFG